MQVFIRSLTAISLLGLAIVAHAQISDDIEAPYARVTGQESATTPGVMTFLGVPYAEPPLEANRWRAPILLTDARRVRAEAYGAQCVQTAATNTNLLPGGGGFAGQFGRGGGGLGGGGRLGGGFGGPPGGFGGFGMRVATSEDCLFLNIWSGADSEDAGAPVLVWIGGEQLQRGAGSNPIGLGEQLASRGVVVASINYRLGTFGFLAHPELSAEAGTSGNYGLLDAIAALQWIKANIESFGGDPNNITVVAASAGADMTAALIGSPEASGLFQKAVLQSGTWMGTGIAKMQTLAEAEASGAALMSAQFPDMDLEDLRDLPYGQLSGKLQDPSIVVDGRIIPRDLAEVFANGEQNAVNVIVGSNKEEGVTFLQRTSIRSPAQFDAYVRERFGALADEFLRMYPSGTTISDEDTANGVAAASNVTALGDELAWAMRKVALSQLEVGSSGYVYEFTRVPPAAGTDLTAPASTHGVEVQYVLNNMGPNRDWTNGDRQLAQVMASYWLNFAETGSPNGNHRWQDDTELPVWPAYSGSDEFQAMEFGDRIGTNPIWQVGPERLELFDRIYEALVLN